MKKLVVGLILLTSPLVAQEYDLGIGTRQTSDLGYEQNYYGDPLVWASMAHTWERVTIEGDVEYVYTRKFFVPAGENDHAVLASWLLSWSPNDYGIFVGAGGRHGSLYTSEWDKVRTGADLALGWNFDSAYNGSLRATAHLEDEDGVSGYSIEYSLDDGSQWFSGLALGGSVIEHSSGGVDYDGYILSMKLNVLSGGE